MTTRFTARLRGRSSRGLSDGSGSFEGLDETGDWTLAWDEIVPGTSAVMSIRPEGTGAGKREASFTAIITARSLDMPYDDLAKFSLSFDISGPILEDTQ